MTITSIITICVNARIPLTCINSIKKGLLNEEQALSLSR